jgi:hypothetical protein
MDVAVPGSPPPSKGKKLNKPAAGSVASTGMELGVLLSFIVLALYLYGFLESIYALPEISDQLAPPRFLGSEANLNVAMDTYESLKEGLVVKESDGTITAAAAGGGGGAKSAAAPQVDASNFVKRTATADIPKHNWPPTVRNEPDRFETIIHPGDGHTTMSVPMFWSPPVHQNGLMTKELALQIGSCSEPDPTTGSYARGEDCLEDDRTIYFAIASYRDFQCRFTVESAFGRAKNPKRIRVGECCNVLCTEVQLNGACGLVWCRLVFQERLLLV